MRRSGLAQHRQPEAGQEIRSKRPEFPEKAGENRHFFLCFALTRPFGPYYNKDAAAAQAARSSGDFCTDGAAVRPHRPAQRMGPPAGSPCGRRTEDSARAGAATPAVLFPRRRKNKRKGLRPFEPWVAPRSSFLLSSRELFVSPAGASFFAGGGPPCRASPGTYSLFTLHLAPPAGLRPAPLPSSLFTLTFFANKAMTCWLVQFAPPISFSPCRRKRNAPRPVQRKKRGWGENQASTVLLLDALVRGGKLVPFGTNLTCPGVPHPLARWPGACRGVVLGVQTCAPSFSFRCRWPGAHVARHFFPLHSYLFLPRSVPLGAGSKAGAGAPGLGRFKEIGSLREGGNRNPPSLKRLFGDFLAAQKVTRGPGPGRPRGLQVCRKPALRARRAR